MSSPAMQAPVPPPPSAPTPRSPGPTWPSLGHGEQGWMPDEKCQRCFHCDVYFGAFRRRHHCRLCGQIFCHNCSSHFVAGKLINRPKEQQSRLCEACTLYCDGLTIHGARARMQSNLSAAGSTRDMMNRQPSGGASSSTMAETTPNMPSFVQADRQISRNEEDAIWPTLIQGEDGMLSTLSDEQDDDDFGCTTEDSDSELDQLMPQGVTEEPRTSETCSYRSDCAASNANEEDGLTSTWYWGDSRLPVQNEAASLAAAAAEHLEELFLEETPSKPAEPRESAAAHGDAWRKMSEVACRHFMRSVHECCARAGGGLEDPTHIRSICELAQQVVDHLSPSLGDSMDILNYVKVKRIPSPGGQITESQVVDGVVFSRDVAHRKMHSTITGCQLALLREPLSFDHDHRLTRLDDLRRQEADFIDLKVGKIAHDLHPTPQLLLCQGGVSRTAQEKLRDRNISLVLGVPSHILDAVARCTGAEVLPNVDSIARFNAPLVGYCRSFTVKRTGETGEVGSKPLAYIEGGARPEQFSTVCLRGEDLQLLSRAKRVLKWAIRLARHVQLESELLFEMWCEPWPRMQPTLPPLRGPGLQEVEYLDLVCYLVVRKDRSCSKPVMLRLPVYALPAAPAQSTVAAPPSGWAGGLNGPLDGFRDCTLHEWLTRCFSPERDAALAPFGGNVAGAFPGEDCRPASDGSCALIDTVSEAGSSMLMESPTHSGADYDDPGSTSPRRRSTNANGSGGVGSRFRELPTPRSIHEILCFQHQRSRLVVFLSDNEAATRTIRARGMSLAARREAYASRTRWALLNRDEEEGCQDGDAYLGGVTASTSTAATARPTWPQPTSGSGATSSFPRPEASGVVALGSSAGGGNGLEATWPEVEMWQWCQQLKRPVTNRSALSSSARRHSTTKFLEMILTNSTSECSKLADVASWEGGCKDPCAHSACRNHVLFFCNPERPLAVGLYWEQVNLWKLQPPHLPYWDPETRLLTAQAGVDSQPMMELDKLVGRLELLTSDIDDLRRSILAALSAAYREQATSPTWAGGSVDDCCSLATAASPGARGAILNVLGQPPWLQDWVLGNRATWHRALKHLTGLYRYLRERLAVAKEKLGRGAGAGDQPDSKANDPVLAFCVQRELLDALREDPVKARESSSEQSSIRCAHTELTALHKPLQQPSSEQRKSTTALGLGVPYGWYLGFKSLLRGEAESSEVTHTATDVPARKRSASTSGRPPMRRRSDATAIDVPRRSRSSGLFGKHRDEGHMWRRTTSTDASFPANNFEVDLLPDLAERTARALASAAEEGSCRLAALERGVQGVCLPVNEDDVGSVITHALLSRQYHEQMSAQWVAVTNNRSSCCPLARPCGDELSCYASLPSTLCGVCAPPETPATSSTAVPALASPRDSLPSMSSTLGDCPWKRLPGLSRSSWEEKWEMKGVRNVLTALPLEQPIRVEFEDKEAKYSVAIHHAAQYHILRHWLCGDDLNFARSLYRCNRIKPSGGKSSAAFFVSQHDRRFLLKAVNRAEFKMLTTPSQAQAMFSYVDQVLFDKLPSALAHVVGLFSVSVKLHKKSRESKPKHFIVQRNLRFSLQNQKRPHFVFDLKGVGNRKVRDVMPGAQGQAQADDIDGEAEPDACQAAAPGGARTSSKCVLWDMNLREWTDGKPLCLVSRDLKYLEAALHNDTYFLNKQSLVDYSLLLAAAEPPETGEDDPASEEPGTLALGIIDWLRPYTWDKHIENVVKTVAQSDRPTVIEPPKYARRFLDAMGTFFVGETSAPQPPS